MIRVESLTKSYGDQLAVDRLSFAVERGEVVGFLGPNGAGKSTTMKMLTGFLHPDRGEVEIAGVRVDPEDPETKRSVGYLPETTALYPRMRVADYLGFVARLRRADLVQPRQAIEKVIEECGLGGWEQKRIGHLSKGYRQRVGLAQALLADPPVLILDEPTSGLDPAEIHRMRMRIRELGRSKTVLLSTHVLSEIQEVCRRVIILANGRLVADGTPLSLGEAERPALQVTLSGGEGIEAALGGLAEVRTVRPRGRDDRGRVGFTLEVEDRYDAALAVVELAARQGWSLFELKHELPSLERIFLRHTESQAAARDGESE